MNLLAKSDVFAENKLFAAFGYCCKKGRYRECAFPAQRVIL